MERDLGTGWSTRRAFDDHAANGPFDQALRLTPVSVLWDDLDLRRRQEHELAPVRVGDRGALALGGADAVPVLDCLAGASPELLALAHDTNLFGAIDSKNRGPSGASQLRQDERQKRDGAEVSHLYSRITEGPVNWGDMPYRRSIFLINKRFQLRFSLYVCSWLFALSLIYPLIIHNLFELFVRHAALDPTGPALSQLEQTRTNVFWLLVFLQLMFLGITFGPALQAPQVFRRCREGQLEPGPLLPKERPLPGSG